MKIITALLAAATIATASAASAERAQLEDYYNEIWCSENGGTTEVRTEMGTRADCLLDDYAVETDFDTKWAEGLGQALHYSAEFERPGAVLLIIQNHDNTDRSRYVDRLASTIEKLGLNIRIFFIQTRDFPLRD
jgi:hypothetical protein